MIARDSRGTGSTAAGEDKGRQDIVEFSTAPPQGKRVGGGIQWKHWQTLSTGGRRDLGVEI